ncbi:helix-turn-helix domain-containing protein [Microbispora sp. RL4-1S]|uniref:Helix-turn-helix domain-containing protein n=1 Tax=Microbispora oryzae TaxID=2806554 RepID=A0A940WGL1_9ACTN|nr:helix-turn-helix transcriptional regulator [Microbispora oryzae]MBP2705151.1 helix-turn-helix domain-containing protein [Microbispora oryzae]
MYTEVVTLMAGTNLTLRRRQLAGRLRQMRRASGMTVEQVAQRLLCSPAKISRMETGQRGVSLRDVRDLCQIYGVPDERVVAELMTLARESRQPGLKQEWGELNDALYTYVDLEAAAVSVVEFQTAYVPALLQTADYARALVRGMLPRIRPEVLDQRVDIRIQRQLRLTEPEPLRYWAFIDEAALRRRVGSVKIMKAQLDHLLEVADLPNVTVQVVPFDVGAYMSSDNPFVFFTIGDPTMPEVVYLESLERAEYLEKESELASYREAVDRIRAAALHPEASLELVQEVNQEYAL